LPPLDFFPVMPLMVIVTTGDFRGNVWNFVFKFHHSEILPSLWLCYLRPASLLRHILLGTHCSLAGATQFVSFFPSLISHFFKFSSVLHLYVSDLMSSRSPIYCHILGVTSLRLFSRSLPPTISILLSVGYLLISSCILGNSFSILVGNLQLVCYTSGVPLIHELFRPFYVTSNLSTYM
jgi:hypothetical protein